MGEKAKAARQQPEAIATAVKRWREGFTSGSPLGSNDALFEVIHPIEDTASDHRGEGCDEDRERRKKVLQKAKCENDCYKK